MVINKFVMQQQSRPFMPCCLRCILVACSSITYLVPKLYCVYSVYILLASTTCREKPLAIYAFSTNKQAQKMLSSRTSSGGFTVNDVLVQFGGMVKCVICVCVLSIIHSFIMCVFHIVTCVCKLVQAFVNSKVASSLSDYVI